MKTFELTKAHEVEKRLEALAVKYNLSHDQLYELMTDLHTLGAFVNDNIKIN